MILLYHETATSGNVATPDNVHGRHYPSRRYVHEGHFVAIDSDDPQVLNHDADLILKIAGFRLATGHEQNAYRKMHEAAGALVEEKQDQPTEPLKETKPPRPQSRVRKG
jgi:hypothetical protein